VKSESNENGRSDLAHNVELLRQDVPVDVQNVHDVFKEQCRVFTMRFPYPSGQGLCNLIASQTFRPRLAHLGLATLRTDLKSPDLDRYPLTHETDPLR